MVITRTTEICRHCSSHNIFPDDKGEPYCGSCGRRQLTHADHGRIGGLQTYLRYGREHFVALGKKGGRPRLRQLPAPIVQSKVGGKLPNRLSELKELYKLRNKKGESRSV